MPHGLPDWGLEGPKSTTYGLDDLGEHAVRLQSPHFFDRRGDCMHLTDFREGLGAFAGTGAPPGWVVDLFTGASRSGAYAVRLTTAGGDGSLAGIHMRLPHPLPSLLGLEFSFGGDGTNYWQGWVDWYTGTRQYLARIRVTEATGLWEYSTGVGTWATLATLGSLVSTDHAMNTLKFVADPTLATPEFVRAILNSSLQPMAGIPVPWIADVVTIPHIRVYIYVEASTDFAHIGYTDNVIVTHNEP